MSSVVVPIYKKEKSAQAFLARAEPVLEHLASYEIIFARSTLRRRQSRLSFQETC